LLSKGHVLVECAIDTPEGTYVADVAWATRERFKIIEDEFSCSVAPEIYVEVWSSSNSVEEIEMKKRLYFSEGALEFWYCDVDGRMTFFQESGQLRKSLLCGKFPAKIES
jgi:Uma2 family endonuclease